MTVQICLCCGVPHRRCICCGGLSQEGSLNPSFLQFTAPPVGVSRNLGFRRQAPGFHAAFYLTLGICGATSSPGRYGLATQPAPFMYFAYCMGVVTAIFLSSSRSGASQRARRRSDFRMMPLRARGKGTAEIGCRYSKLSDPITTTAGIPPPEPCCSSSSGCSSIKPLRQNRKGCYFMGGWRT